MPIEPWERFERLGPSIVRAVLRRDGREASSSVIGSAGTTDLAAAFDLAWLRSDERLIVAAIEAPVTVVDLFAGCGGLTLGIEEAARAVGRACSVGLAVDAEPSALEAYERNFAPRALTDTPVELLFDGEVGDALTAAEVRTLEQVPETTILIGGPPCQGHSDLNNHTRRRDPKNALYFKMARAAEVLAPEHVVIENVPGVVHSRDRVVPRTIEALQALGYHVDHRVVDCAMIGVAQRRKRFLIVASRRLRPDLQSATVALAAPPRGVGWAVEDLMDVVSDSTFDTSAKHSAVNQDRIRYLFEHDLDNLPDSERPDCHRLKKHSYKSVYGRMDWDTPAPTITSGFGSTGQGRFVHPKRQRTLTPHEAARAQFFPDFFQFGASGRVALQTMIGNAVPPKLGYLAGLELLR